VLPAGARSPLTQYAEDEKNWALIKSPFDAKEVKKDELSKDPKF